ncbi:MAG: polyhydroxyalkanoate synthesis regulator DNA-binding domain-containing protein [Acidobacteriota bacterium]|nr:polyhydroxyalkanoate synthesis regulator DNA-binding domain-containing protein [Acidobacteriota bacterium]
MAQKTTKSKTHPAKKRAPKKASAKSFGIETDQPVNDNTVVIKRYGNRRLYNTETGSYVTYQDLIAIIRTGHDVQVIDSTSQTDVTKSVLMQAILEEEKNQSLLPLPFLFQILRSREDSIQDFLKNHLAASFDAYLKTKEEFDRRFRSFLELGATAPQMWEQLVPGAEVIKSFFTGPKPQPDSKDDPKSSG